MACKDVDVWEEGPILSQVNSLILRYPVSGPHTLSVTLRAPNFGNTEVVSKVRIYRESRVKTLSNFSDPLWPDSRIMHFSFAYLTLQQRDDFMSFVKATLGQRIEVVDHESTQWIGIITNPNGSSVQEYQGECSYTCEFDLDVNPTS